MEKVLKLLTSAFFTACMITFFGCKKDAEIPALTAPSIITTSVSMITTTTAEAEGNVTSSGGTTITDIGFCWSTSPNPAISSNKTSNVTGIYAFTGSITGLMADTKYYIRAYATNSAGTSYGNEVAFTTSQIIKSTTIPTLTTADVTSITSTSAISGGNITDDGGGDIIVKGISWNTIPDWNIYSYDETIYGNGPGSGSFVSYLSNLSPGTTYYVKAYAVNDKGIAFGSTLSFTTDATDAPDAISIIFNPDLTYGSVSDMDGNFYKTIQIGNQTWMAENLKTTKYNDGSLLPNVTDNTYWGNLTTGGYSWYNNSASSYKDTYGALYNWYAVTDARKLCPAGWRVPTVGDWITLQMYLGGALYSGSKLKEAGTTHWLSPNVQATNETGFTGLPGGSRLIQDIGSNSAYSFGLIGSSGNWWSATGFGYGEASSWVLSTSGTYFESASNFLNDGNSVRCIRN
jgi:uncharacterized protein (TIGR02145 family)